MLMWLSVVMYLWELHRSNKIGGQESARKHYWPACPQNYSFIQWVLLVPSWFSSKNEWPRYQMLIQDYNASVGTHPHLVVVCRYWLIISFPWVPIVHFRNAQTYIIPLAYADLFWFFFWFLKMDNWSVEARECQLWQRQRWGEGGLTRSWNPHFIFEQISSLKKCVNYHWSSWIDVVCVFSGVGCNCWSKTQSN